MINFPPVPEVSSAELATALEAGHGGLMLGPTHVLEPEVPVENVVAFFEACDGLTYEA